MQGINYLGDKSGRKKQKGQNDGAPDDPGVVKGGKLLPPPGLGGLREAAPPPEGPPSRAEPRSRAVRVGTTKHMS